MSKTNEKNDLLSSDLNKVNDEPVFYTSTHYCYGSSGEAIDG